MGLRDRPYYDHGGSDDGGDSTIRSGVLYGMPRPLKAVRMLLLANLLGMLLWLFEPLYEFLALPPSAWWQPWRYITFQFLHAGIMHLFFNLMGLFFLGMVLERTWGSKRFLRFYLGCGVVAGLSHVIMAALSDYSDMNIPLVGASGGVYAILLACAVYFPEMKVIVFLFPMPIRVVALLFIGLALFMTVLGVVNPGRIDSTSHPAHLGGAVAAAFYIWVLPKLTGRIEVQRERINRGAWQRKQQRRAREEQEIDAILQKIRDQGISSLTMREKQMLRDATERQREQERRDWKS